MGDEGGKRFMAAALFLFFSILLVLMSDIASGEGLYTRVDELSCGNTVVKAFTTCTEDSHHLDTAVCTDQHFIFINKKTGLAVKIDASGKPVVGRDLAGGKIPIRYDALARDWACLKSRTGSYVYIEYLEITDPTEEYASWEELLDLKGRTLANERRVLFSKWSGSRKTWERASERIEAKFNKVWNSKGLPRHPAPDYDFVPIQIFKTDRTEKYFPWGDNQTSWSDAPQNSHGR